jgi:16S rRNA (adenine1518-N6/adenine1519-N6)-dimethyltransferase
MSLRATIAADLAAAGLAPLHRLGQNFMVDEHALARLVEELRLLPGERVVEIGPGTGVLTERLLAAGARVLAVELDRGLAGLLTAKLVPRGLERVASEGAWKLGANLPYDIALPVLLDAAALPRPPSLAVVTVQWEAAQRLCAQPGSDAWGASAAVLQAAGTPAVLRRLGPTSFHPQPRVDSAILRWTPARALPAGFGAWCRAVFAARRKVLPRALRDAGLEREVADAAVASCALDPTRRLESLTPSELLALHAVIAP